jgi:threonine/homoserine/homoserine lactone efflux protein
MEALAILGVLVVAFFAWLILRAKGPKKMESEALDPHDANMTLDMILDEAEKTNELLRQLIRAYGHEPEA